jgi:regulator of protease activity HflC (stomatin/prohibitin superfamily)
MQNLVNEVLQAAVGNFFRDQFGSMKAIEFIQTRQQVQEKAFAHIEKQLQQYDVETKGVYIQDVILPEALVIVLTEREIANQQITTFEKQRDAQDKRINMEKSTGLADVQRELATSEVGITIKANNANARKAEAEGEAAYISKTGLAQADVIKAKGQASGEGYRTQVEALGQGPTAIVNAITALSAGKNPIMPNILVVGSGSGGGTMDALIATLTDMFQKKSAASEKGKEEIAETTGLGKQEIVPDSEAQVNTEKPGDETKPEMKEEKNSSKMGKNEKKKTGKHKGDDDVSQE